MQSPPAEGPRGGPMGPAAVPMFVAWFAGVAVGLSLLLCALVLHGTLELSWFYVSLPILLAAGLVLISFTVACGLWIHGALRLCGAASSQPSADAGDLEYRLDILFKTAKICFICHGYTTLICISLWLLVMKLEYWPKIPAVYPLVPIIVLGLLHVLLAIMFKQPEIDPPRSAGIGISFLAHAVALVLKLDHSGKVASGDGSSGALPPASDGGGEPTAYPWAVVFLPSWLTYAWVAFACAREASRSLALLREEVGAEKNARRNLWFAVGGFLWAAGFCSSQVMLALRLDGLVSASRLTWIAILAPALLGWCALVVCGVGTVSRYFGNLAVQLAGSFSPSTAEPDQEPQVTTGLLSGIANGP